MFCVTLWFRGGVRSGGAAVTFTLVRPPSAKALGGRTKTAEMI